MWCSNRFELGYNTSQEGNNLSYPLEENCIRASSSTATSHVINDQHNNLCGLFDIFVWLETAGGDEAEDCQILKDVKKKKIVCTAITQATRLTQGSILSFQKKNLGDMPKGKQRMEIPCNADNFASMKRAVERCWMTEDLIFFSQNYWRASFDPFEHHFRIVRSLVRSRRYFDNSSHYVMS